MGTNDRGVLAIVSFPVGCLITYAIGYPLNLQGTARLILLAAAWWTVYRISIWLEPDD